jgi:peptide chain release factor subunit 1
MISREELQKLIEYKGKPGGCVLSIYLEVDQSQANNLNRGFEATLKKMLRSEEEKIGDKSRRKEFAACAKRMQEYVGAYEPKKRTLVLFCSVSGDFFWDRELNVLLPSSACWNSRPRVRPLLEAYEHFELYGVILADKHRSRLFTVFMNHVEEHLDAFTEADVKHIKGPGSDHIRSQAQVQRKADGHALQHLKHTAELMDTLADQFRFDHLVLAGPVAATSELQHLLPERLRRRVAATVALPLEATSQEVLRETTRIQEQEERAKEEHLVSELITAAAKNNHAVTGLSSTLRSLGEGRVWHLLYADGFVPHGGECNRCGRLVEDGRPDCPFCGTDIKPVKDVIETALGKVVGSGGKYGQVRDRAAERLKLAGGVGAFLRF